MVKTTLNAATMKKQNQKKIIATLMITECSRAELSRKTGLTRAAISIIADELLEQGVIMEGDPILGKVGRKSFVLKLNPDRFHMIGIDLARDKCHVGFMNFKGEILYATNMPMLYSAAGTLTKIQAIIEQALDNNAFPGELLGIGITAPGPLDTQNGIILTPPDFSQWFHINVTHFFQQWFDCPVWLENNANARALAEKYLGAGNQYANFVDLIIDSGIGTGIILESSLFRASSGFGNNFGHMSINFDGIPCTCGNTGCAELYASIPNIIKYAKTIDTSLSSWPVIVDKASGQNPNALKVMDKEADYLKILITNIMNILDVDCIVMSGDIIYKPGLFIELLKDKMKNCFLSRDVKDLRIMASPINDNAQIIAASYLVIENHLNI